MTTKEQDYFRTFCAVSSAFGTTLGEKEILDLIVGSSIETMDGKAACLFLADEDEDIFVPVAQKGLSEDYLHAKPMRARRVVDELLHGGHLAIKDAVSDPRLENHEAKKAEGIASILVLPVMVAGKAIGVLSLYSGTPREFTQDEVDFQKALAEQGGTAIQRARLFERVRQNAQLFYDLSSGINSSLDIKQVLHILTAEVGEALGMKGVTIRLLNKTTNELDLVAAYGLSEEYLNKGSLSAKSGVSRAISGEPVAITDVENDTRVQYPEVTSKEGIKAVLSVPIKSRDEVIGVMKLCSGVKRDFPEDIVNLAMALAHQGGLAIQNASMYLMLEQDKRNLEQDIWTHKAWF
jgi:GAF domain-containing protein